MRAIIISGAEATCKSTIARNIATELNITYQSKDKIKEALFDSEKHTTWDFSWYESKAKDLFFSDIEKLVRADKDFVIESNFIGEDKQRLKHLLTPSVELSEIHCYAKGLTSFTRAFKRNETKQRHPGHHDRRWYPKILLQSSMHSVGINIGAHKPVVLNEKVLYLDTTDIHSIDYDKIFEFIS